jgi:dihydrofolate reductase
VPSLSVVHTRPVETKVGDGKVLLHTTVTLDGFVAGPDHEMDWNSVDWTTERQDGISDGGWEIIRGCGAIIGGRHWYDVATERYDGLDGIYGGNWTGPVFVITHRAPDLADVPDQLTFATNGVRDAVNSALAAADGKNVVLLGAETFRHCLAEGLVDELILHVVPILLGEGVRLFGGTGEVRLDPIDTERSGPINELRYRVVK